MSELARRYAQALYGIYPNEGTLDLTAKRLMENQELWESLCSPAVQAEEKERVLSRLPMLEDRKSVV